MKKHLLVAAASLTISTGSIAQNFQDILQKSFMNFDTTQNKDLKLDAGHKLELIAKKYDKEWLAPYYAAYCMASLVYVEKDATKNDGYLDEADNFVAQAVSLLGKDNDETYVLKAMIANARISVDPRNRGQKYAATLNQNLNKAHELNPDNPRIYLLAGISNYYLPKMFGGGKKAALPRFEKADSLFAKQTAKDITKPYWGKQTNDQFLALSKGED